MKRILAIIIVLFSISLAGCFDTPTEYQFHEVEHAKSLVSNLVYVKEIRTKQCYGYSLNTGNGITILVPVPCEKIPPKMLHDTMMKE